MRPPRHKYDARPLLEQAGVSPEDARRLLRVSRQLRRWHELECGTEEGGVQRNEETGVLMWYSNRTHAWTPYGGRDNETQAKHTLDQVMARYPHLRAFIQGDPRGCALYILRLGDVPDGELADAYYTNGIAVYKE